jgi:hypothetical protein
LSFMEPHYDWLNVQIERLQADRSVRPGNTRKRVPGVDYEPDSGDVALLRMAAHFNGLRPGALTPDPGFISDLRSRLRMTCPESPGHGPAHR